MNGTTIDIERLARENLAKAREVVRSYGDFEKWRETNAKTRIVDRRP